MHLDAITLAAVMDEWRVLLTGARIDTIIQPTAYAIALQCYAPHTAGHGGQNHWLYLSAHPQLARAHLTAHKPAKIASEPPPFVMLLRKYLEGARIESFAQPRWERVLEIVAGHRKSPESDERVRYRLLIEIMGRVSNIIFCNEQGMILGSLKQIGADINRYRIIAPNVPYTPPPPQMRQFAGQHLPRLEPETVTASQLSLAASNTTPAEEQPSPKKTRGPQKLFQLLTGHLLGFSPLLAREAVYRTTGDTEVALPFEDWEELAWNVRDLASLYQTRAWRPHAAEQQEDNASTTRMLAFAPYFLAQYTEVNGVQVHSANSINNLIDEYYARAEWQDALESLRAPIKKALQTQLERCKRRAEHLQQELSATAEADQYRLQGELLLAYQNDVQQGQSSVALPNIFENPEAPSMVTIPLDPRLDAVGNANRLFHKYHKLRRALDLIPAQVEQNRVELATVEQLFADLMLAETPAEVALVKAEVQTAGYMRGKPVERQKKQAKGKGGKQQKGKPVPPGGGVPLHTQSRDGFTILIGKNSRQNEEVTFHQATSNDIWLHARGVPGAHVIIKAGGREIPRRTIEEAAALAAWYSQARGSTSVPVDYTLQRHVRHMKGGGPGMVIYERERTLYATPSPLS